MSSQASQSPSNTTIVEFLSYLSQDPSMLTSKVYSLACKARIKLGNESLRRDHHLNLLVGHANLLDKLMVHLVEVHNMQTQLNQASDEASDDNLMGPLLLERGRDPGPAESSLLEDDFADLDSVTYVEYLELNYKQAQGVDDSTAASHSPSELALRLATTLSTLEVTSESGEDDKDNNDHDQHADADANNHQDERTLKRVKSRHTQAGSCRLEHSHESNSYFEDHSPPILLFKSDSKISNSLSENLAALLEPSWTASHDLMLLRTQCESFF